MFCSIRIPLLLIASALATSPIIAQQSPPPGGERLRIGATGGYLTFGSYFSGPTGLQFSNDDGFAFGAEAAVPVTGNLSLVGNVLHATSDWSFQQVPLLGSVSIGGANLWLLDAGLRLHFPLGPSGAVLPFIEAGAGAIRYAVNNPLLSGNATNFALVGGVGILTRLGERFALQARVKDHAASFRSVNEAAALGVRGRWAHTVGFLVGLSVGI